MATKNGQQGGLNDFTLVEGFRSGYRNREDITVLPPGILVEGSQNVLTDTFQRIGNRKGYTLDGDANDALAPIARSFDWFTSKGGERNMRAGFLSSAGNDAKLQYRYNHNYPTTDLITNGGFTGNADGWTVGNAWAYSNDSVTTIASGTNLSQTISLIAGVTYTVSFTTSGGNSEALIVRLGTNSNSVSFNPAAATTTTTYTTAAGSENSNITFINSGSLICTLDNVSVTIADSSIEWRDLLTAQSSANFNFTTFWDFTTEKIELMLAVNGESNIVEWSGAITTLASATNDTTIHLVGNNASLTAYAAPTGTASFTAGDNGAVGTALASFITLNGNPTDGQTIVLNINATAISFQFVTVIGAAAGNVLIAGTAALTAANWLNLLQNPASTTANQVALSGGNQTIVAYSTYTSDTGTLTKSGVTTWAEEGFYLAGTRQVTINGTVYTYTGGEFSTTLTGVTPDPSSEPANSIVHQTPRITANASMTALPATFKNTLIANLNNQIYISASDQNSVYISKVNNYQDYSFATPRVVGEGAIVTPDSVPSAFIPQENSIYITAGMDEWYDMSFTLSSDNVSEAITINRLNTASQQASISQLATTKINNDVIYISHEPIVNTFGRVDNVVLTPQITDVSFSIVNDMNSFDFTGAALWYYRKFVYMSVPAEGVVMMYNMTDSKNPYWEAPQRLSISCFSIIGGQLYGHSSLVPETYKLFDGYNDNGNPIDAKATFSFNNYGTRSSSKGYDEFYVEGYITSNTTVTLGIQYDIDGCATNTSFPIDGTAFYVCKGGQDNSLGKNELGKKPLGSLILPASATLPPKFRVIKTFPIHYFYEDQISFESSGIDEQWEIICFGPQITTARDLNNSISD